MDELPPARALAPNALEAALKDLPAWRYDGERRALFRGIVLEDFSEAIGVMVRVAIEAEKANHHPEWTNVYNRLDIWLTTHDANGVSDRDVNLARRIDAMVRPERSCADERTGRAVAL